VRLRHSTLCSRSKTSKAEEKKPGKRPCILIEVRGPGTGAPPTRPDIFVLCRYRCGTEERILKRFGTDIACYENIPTY